MPVYEYNCRQCANRFERLRSFSRIDDPVTCPEGHEGGERVLSRFAAVSKGAGGEANAVGGCGGGCSGCGGGNCGNCNLN